MTEPPEIRIYNERNEQIYQCKNRAPNYAHKRHKSFGRPHSRFVSSKAPAQSFRPTKTPVKTSDPRTLAFITASARKPTIDYFVSVPRKPAVKAKADLATRKKWN